MSPSTDVANTDLVLLAMALAGAGDDFADIEDIAVEAWTLSPQRFGWRTKPYPSDKIAVQAIADLESKHDKDALTLRGFKDRADKVATRRLTAEGRKAALRAGAKVAGREFPDLAAMMGHFRQSGSDAPEPTPADRRRVQAELGELRRHRAFQAWADSGESCPWVRRGRSEPLLCWWSTRQGRRRGVLAESPPSRARRPERSPLFGTPTRRQPRPCLGSICPERSPASRCRPAARPGLGALLG